MSKLHKVVLNGKVFFARSGQLLLDAALVNGVDLAHDCRAGRCGTCITRVVDGITVGGATRQTGMVHACQAHVLSDLTLACELLPPVDVMEGRVAKLADVADDVAELTIQPARKPVHLPGQYYRFTFQGYPARAFSPTEALDGKWLNTAFKLNIKRVRDGRVSSQLGTGIQAGHRVRMTGPFGHAFLRPSQKNRLVLIAGGTGFAPIWAIAQAALRENPFRPVWMVAGVRKLPQLYMGPALELANRFPNVTAVGTVDSDAPRPKYVAAGAPERHLPPLAREDTVYACGGPAMVEAVAAAAGTAGATFYADPFEAAPPDEALLIDRIGTWLRGTGAGRG
jgi:CDP-4-dehydro-6-deoxyglucose reductase, E3